MKLKSLTYLRFLVALMMAILSQLLLSSIACADSPHLVADAIATASNPVSNKNIGLSFDLTSSPVTPEAATPEAAIPEAATPEAATQAAAETSAHPVASATLSIATPIAASQPPDRPAVTPTLPLPPPQPAPAPPPAAKPRLADAMPMAIAFDLPKVTSHQPPALIVATPSDRSSTASVSAEAIDSSVLFKGDSDSLVARAVGSAEGTRTPDGQRNPAYYGHVDPGNGAWNLGSFSYQHGASSPEEADFKQLRRLQTQAAMLQAKAVTNRLELTLEQKLNGIDLANQSPRAALDRGGYIDRLAQAQQMGLENSDAVLWARTRAFLDPDTQRWNAPGLGNNVYSITHDQERRQRAIARAIAVYQRLQETPGAIPPAIAETTERLMAQNTAAASSLPALKSTHPESAHPESAAIDQILHLDLPDSNP